MELVVISGKGGTGKTSITGSLASLSRDKVLVDCDVDAADLHLILQNNVQETTEFIGGKKASINEDKCTNCGICQDYCRFDAIKHDVNTENPDDEKYWIESYSCDGCGVCVRHCPEDAIDFKDVISGEWYISDTPYGPLVHARLGVAQSNSGKLVSELRQQAKQLAHQRELDMILIDGPPGIGCPVTASITGVGYVLVVTEPSMSALHDMERLLQLTSHFKIPTGICINKFDINLDLTSRIEDFAKEQNVKLLGRIPFDHDVTKAQMAGMNIIEHNDNGVSNSIKKLWSNLNEEFRGKWQ